MKDEVMVIHMKDETPFGYDVTEDERRVWYFIQMDFFGDNRHLGIWNPDNRLRSYKSFKEALLYLAIAEEHALFPQTICRVVRSYGQYDFKNITVIETKDENEYYKMIR
ncbi:MAG: hypothetical protein GX306_06615 [Clostridiales bacterium]|jgi:hypothetical protein|nr:hypothetical protein [Clostridiales bacterium]